MMRNEKHGGKKAHKLLMGHYNTMTLLEADRVSVRECVCLFVVCTQ